MPEGQFMNIAYIVCAGALLLAGSAAAQQGDKVIPKTTISLGTATPGGGFPLYGNAFAEVLNAADPTLEIVPRNTKGSNENIPLLESDGLDIALVAGEPSYEAFMGIGRAATSSSIRRFRPRARDRPPSAPSSQRRSSAVSWPDSSAENALSAASNT